MVSRVYHGSVELCTHYTILNPPLSGCLKIVVRQGDKYPPLQSPCTFTTLPHSVTSSILSECSMSFGESKFSKTKRRFAKFSTLKILKILNIIPPNFRAVTTHIFQFTWGNCSFQNRNLGNLTPNKFIYPVHAKIVQSKFFTIQPDQIF